ncbi:MAG: HU family DNA-binding protein [Magnetococcales bacterium]|nr:HU family DNA-binding protein [Magnetococcales bacterium]
MSNTEDGPLNKTELVDAVAAKTGLPKVQTAACLDAIMQTVRETLGGGGSVSLIGFGTFAVAERAARSGRNPQTGKRIDIPAGRLPRFRPGKLLKDAVAIKEEPPAKRGAKKKKAV